MNSNLKVTVNPQLGASVDFSQWNLADANEPQRVGVRFRGKEYITVLSNPVTFEIWSVDANGELDIQEQIIDSDSQVRKLMDDFLSA